MLLSTAGVYTQISIVLLVSLAIFAFYMFLVIKYIILVAYDENVRAERYAAYTGYLGVAAAIILFLLICFGFKNSIVDNDCSEYYGLIAAIGALAILPEYILFDIKQIKWIKGLSLDEQKKYGVSVKDRIPLIVVMSIILIINMGLFGLIVERFIFVIQGIIG